MKPSRIGRIVKVLTALQTGKHYTIHDLSKMFGTSRRTISCDLKGLQAIGVPCHYDAKTGVYIIEPDFLLSHLNLTLQETMGLLLLVHKIGKQIHFPFKRSALSAALKIESNLPIKIRQYCNAALRNISIKVDCQVGSSLLDKIFVQLLKAILRKYTVSIKYRLPQEHKSVEANFSPYHLILNDNTWYVLGKMNIQKGFHALKLNRIKQVSISDKCFIEDEKFNMSEYIGRTWSMTPEGKLYDVKLRFLPKVAHSVAEVKWHSTQKVTFEEDGSAIVEFRVDGLSEITWWILGYGDQVQVLTPEILRQRIVEIAQNMIRQNQQLLSV